MSTKCRTVIVSALVAMFVFSFTLSAHAAVSPYQFGNFAGYNWGKLPPIQQQPVWQVPSQPRQPDTQQPQQPGTQQPQQPSPQQPQQPNTTAPTAAQTADEKRMLDLVNAERAKNGLAPLALNKKVTEVARVKAKDMIDNKYFSHNSPIYGSPFEMLRSFGVSYRTAGENLAGNSSVDSAHTGLMNSPGHRANILNGNFKEVGIGIVNGEPYGKMMVQLFIG